MVQPITRRDAALMKTALWMCVAVSSAVAANAYAQAPSAQAPSDAGTTGQSPTDAPSAPGLGNSPPAPPVLTGPSSDAGTVPSPSESKGPAEAGSPQPAQGESPRPSNPDTADSRAASSDDDSTLSTVIVTGVRGGPPRTVSTSPAPIDVVSGEALVKTGRAELGEAIAKLLPSINFGTSSAGIGSIVRPVINRGLGPAYTLVLINGKRRHSGTQITGAAGDTSGVNPVDMDMIPTSAIDYIEILKDSAAAQYGSDAVAGVINVVLKKEPTGGHVGLLAGRLYQGNGDLNADKAEADVGFHLGPKGFLHVTADARNRGMSWSDFPATGPNWAPATNLKNAYWNGDGSHHGDPAIEAGNLSYNLETPFHDVTFYSFSTVGYRWTEEGNIYRKPNGLASFSMVFPSGYFPLNNTREYDLQVVAGGKGDVSGVKIDLSSSYGLNHLIQYSDSTINPSLGPTSPQSFNYLAGYQFEQWTQNLDLTHSFDVGLPQPLQLSGGLELRTERFKTYAGDPLGYENGGYVFQPGDQEGDPNVGKPAAVGAQAGIAIRPSDAVSLTRNVFSGYVDSAIYPTKAWYNDVAVRAEHYDDSGNNTIGGKLNSRIDVLQQLALRGTVGTGFRAPSLTQIGYAETDNRTNTNPLTGATGPSYSILAPTRSPLARALGAQELKPEESVNIGLGAVARPFDRLNITVDGYEVDISDRIGRTTALLGPAIAPALQANGYTGTEWVYYFANQASTRTRGVDIVVDWSRPLGPWGAVYVSAAFNYNVTEITKVNATPPALAALHGGPTSNLVFFGRSVAGDLTVNTPRDKLILTGRWHAGPVRLTLTETRYGAYDWVRSQLASQDTYYGAKWLTDVDFTYMTKDGVEFSIGANNVFSVYPDKNGPGDPTSGSWEYYYGPAPFSPFGGFYYGKVAYNF